MSQPIEVRIAVAEERLDTIEEEQLRHRQRLHELEGDRATMKLLGERLEQLSRSVERSAKQAAQEAIDLAFDHKDDLGRRRWGLRLQWLMFGVAVGALIVALAALFVQ